MSPSLVAEKGFGESVLFQIKLPILVAGNSKVVELPILNEYVSRRHFQLRHDIDVFYIKDLNNTNGTYLNGERLRCQIGAK